MTKEKKLTTPEWILKGYDSLEEYEKSKGKKADEKKFKKTFKLRKCPKCKSDKVNVVVGEVGIWECKKCGWKGKDVIKEELSEDELMIYLDKIERSVK